MNEFTTLYIRYSKHPNSRTKGKVYLAHKEKYKTFITKGKHTSSTKGKVYLSAKGKSISLAQREEYTISSLDSTIVHIIIILSLLFCYTRQPKTHGYTRNLESPLHMSLATSQLSAVFTVHVLCNNIADPTLIAQYKGLLASLLHLKFTQSVILLVSWTREG